MRLSSTACHAFWVFTTLLRARKLLNARPSMVVARLVLHTLSNEHGRKVEMRKDDANLLKKRLSRHCCIGE
jgi:hypothetical protein